MHIFEEAFAHFIHKFFIAMKKFLITGLAIMLSSGALMAQYDDDAYSPGNDRNNTPREESYYDRNDGRDRYNEYDENDGYIDYDDDSYTSRFRRFNNVYMGYNYWSPAYSPYWANPYYLDPFCYSPYRPGFSFGFGYGPYWSSSWGMCNWWGYNGFGYWNNPYYGGWGNPYYYGGGYWNGYGDYWNNYGNNRRTVNYGPRGSFGAARGSSFGVRPAPGTPASGGSNYVRRGAVPGNNNGPVRGGNTRVLDNNGTRQVREAAPRNIQPERSRTRDVEVAPSRNPQRYNNSGNNRVYDAQPTRTYSPPARNFDGGGSRSGNSGGMNNGGSRSSGGGYRR